MVKFSKKASAKQLIQFHQKWKGYGFVHDQKFYYTGVLTGEQLLESLSVTAAQITKLWTEKLKNSSPFPLSDFLSEEKMQELVLELGIDFTVLPNWSFFDSLQDYFFAPSKLQFHRRPPVVAIMGHVDHGKTTLLDAIRNSQLIAKESGQITQKIGAYQIEFEREKITFLDTPGHEFFSAIRARGAALTDLVVLVVSGTEGIKPQTTEALDHIVNAKLPVIVFINKSDQPEFQTEHIKTGLSKWHLVAEEYGGDTLFLSGSALQKKGISELLTAIKTTTAALPLETMWNHLARAVVLDCYVERSGPAVSVLVEKGVLHLRHFAVAMGITGRIKSMTNDRNVAVKTAFPGDCVVISGLNSTVAAGTKLYTFPDEKFITFLQSENFFISAPAAKKSNLSPADIFNQMLMKRVSPTSEVNLIIKFDTKGSEDAFRSQMAKLPKGDYELKFIHIGTGIPKQSDLNLAKTTNARLLLFNLPLNRNLVAQIKTFGLEYEQFEVIYKLWERLELLGQKSLEPVEKITIIGEGKIIKVFDHSKFGKIAGCLVVKGKFIKSENFIRVFRGNKLLGEKLKLRSLGHLKSQIDQIGVNQECGIVLDRFTDFQLDDRVEQYSIDYKSDE